MKREPPERTVAIEDAFCALEGVSSAKLCLEGEIEGVDLAAHPAIRLRRENPNTTLFVFLAREILSSFAPDEIAAHYSEAIQHYSKQHAA